jgi:hypothetical protein
LQQTQNKVLKTCIELPETNMPTKRPTTEFTGLARLYAQASVE